MQHEFLLIVSSIVGMERERDNTLSQKIGAELRSLRLARDMSMQDVAGHIGITYQQVQKYETGVGRWPVDMIYKYCEAIEIAPVEVFKTIEERNETTADTRFTGKKNRAFLHYFAEIENEEVRSNIIALLKSLRPADFR